MELIQADDYLTVFKHIGNLLRNHNNNQSMLSCSWGTDRDVIATNAKRNLCPDPFKSLPSINLAAVAADKLCRNNRTLAREEVEAILGLPHSQCRHEALDDALDVKTLFNALKDLDS